MNVQVATAIIASVIYLGMTVFVYFRDPKNIVNRHFAVLLICIAIWCIDIAGIRWAPNAVFADTWGNVFRTGLLLIPPTFLHFSLVFTNPVAVKGKAKRTLAVFYVASCFFCFINWTEYFTGEVIQTKWGYVVQSGPLYPLFIMQFIAALVFSFYYLLKSYREADSYQQQRVKYFFLSIVVSFALGSLSFLPTLGVPIFHFGPMTAGIGLVIAAYSVVQNRLIDVSVFLVKTIGYFVSIIFLAVPAFVLIVLLQNAFLSKTSYLLALLIVLIGAVAALVFEGIKNYANRALHHIILKDKYYYHQILKDFSRRLITIVDLGRLLNTLGDTIEKSMGVKNLSLFLYNIEKEIYRPALLRGDFSKSLPASTLKKDNSCIQWLEKGKEILLRAEVEKMPKTPVREDLQNFLKSFGAEVCLPLIYLDRLIGFIILGHKAEEEMYYREDLDLLGSLANQIAISIENANLYENLKKSQLMMRRADRLASLGTLIAGLAHEIRNPLVSIKTFTQLLPERMDDEEFRNYFLTVASGEIDRLTTLINELLGFAKPSEPNLKGENVNSIIDKMEFLISTEAKKKNITITKNYSTDLPPVMADAEQIKQVLLNILLNGMQAIEGEQGQVWIETRVGRVAREGGIEPFVQIEIRDNGVGISKENLDHIFDPFFTTRPEGSGLGLAITYQIVHEHGGFIDVESEIGKGTSFRVNFPLKAGENGSSQPQ